MKTYFDLFISKDMSSKFLFLAFGSLLIFCFIFLFDKEFKGIKYLAGITSLGFDQTYWLAILLLGCGVIVGNIVVFVRCSRECTLVESDLKKSIQHLNRKRKTTDLFSGKVVYQSYPKFIVTAFIVIVLFSVCMSINDIIVVPLFELSSNEINSSQVAKIDMTYFYGLGVLSYFPAYIFIVIGMLLKLLNSRLWK